MSFGSENPELWDEICKNGIVHKLRSQLEKEGFDPLDGVSEEIIVDVLYEIPKVRNALLDWSNREICNAEADYHGSKVDEAVMTYEKYHKWG